MFWVSCFIFGFGLQIHVRAGADHEEMFLRSRRAQSTSSGERPAKGFPSDALTVMGSLLADSTGGILVFLLALRRRLLRRGPSFDPAFFFLYQWGCRAAGSGGGGRKRVASSYSGESSLFVAARRGRRVETVPSFCVDHNYEKRWTHLTSCDHRDIKNERGGAPSPPAQCPGGS